MTARSPSFSSDDVPTPSDDFGALLGPLMQEVPLLLELEEYAKRHAKGLEHSFAFRSTQDTTIIPALVALGA